MSPRLNLLLPTLLIGDLDVALNDALNDALSCRGGRADPETPCTLAPAFAVSPDADSAPLQILSTRRRHAHPRWV